MTERLKTIIEIKLEKVPSDFSVGERILGEAGENITYVEGETRAVIQSLAKGINRSHVTLIVRHLDVEGLKKAEDLIHSLIATVKDDYQDFLIEQPPFIQNRYKLEDLTTHQTYACEKCKVTVEDIQAYTNHLSSQWHVVKASNNASVAQPRGPPAPPGQFERKEFVGTVTDVKGFQVIVSDSILYDTRHVEGGPSYRVGDKLKGVQVPCGHALYKWKAVSVTSLTSSVDKAPKALPSFDSGRKVPSSLPGSGPRFNTVDNKRGERMEQQLLKAFSFHLNEQTTPKALWNTHHMVQQQAKNRPFARPPLSQSPTFCMLCNLQFPPAMMQGHLRSEPHRIKFVEKQLELGLERFPLVYGMVPLPGVITNNGKRLAVDALAQHFGYDLPSHNADAYKSMILMFGALKSMFCEICQHTARRYDQWIGHVISKQHAMKCVEFMASSGLQAFLQRYKSTPAPAPKNLKEAIKIMADRIALSAVRVPEFKIETETVPDLDSAPEQPVTQSVKPGLLGRAPGPLSPPGFVGGPKAGFHGRPGDAIKRAAPGADFSQHKRIKAMDHLMGNQKRGLLGTPPRFNERDNRGGWDGGFVDDSNDWARSKETWDAPPGFKLDDTWDDAEGGEYVGGFGSSNGSSGKRKPNSLLNLDVDRDWDQPDRSEFVGGGADDNFVGGGDPQFVPAVNPNVAASILEAAQGLMQNVQQREGFMGGPGGFRQGNMSQGEMAAVQALGNNIRSLIKTMQTPQAMHPGFVTDRLTPMDRQFLGEVQRRTGIRNIPLLVRLVQTVRSLPPRVYDTLSNINPQILLNALGGNSPQQKTIVKQILGLMGSGRQPEMMGPGMNRPGLLGEHPGSVMRHRLGPGPGGLQSLLDMPVSFRG